MKTVIAVLLCMLSFAANASLANESNSLVAKTRDNIGTVFSFYDKSISTTQSHMNPLCAGRSYMAAVHRDGTNVWGCWWMVSERMFALSSEDKMYEFDMNLVLMNNNFKDSKRPSKNL